VPAYYALILRSLTVLEGLALQADKNYKLLGKAYPYMAKRLLLDPAPELRWDGCMLFREMADCLPLSGIYSPHGFVGSRKTAGWCSCLEVQLKKWPKPAR
jgi:hypothetical protein